MDLNSRINQPKINEIYANRIIEIEVIDNIGGIDLKKIEKGLAKISDIVPID